MRRLKIISIVMLLSIVVLLPKSNAALVSKPGTSPLVNTTVSNSYLLCHKMKGLGESLYGAGSNVQPHLATNKDWGAVSYLSNSIYGTNTTGGNTGITVTISGVNYYSTTTNITGVMNWGINPNVRRFTQTAGLINNYSLGSNNVTELYNNRETKYVEYINPTSVEDSNGMSIKSYGFYTGTDTAHPGSMRNGLFMGNFGANNAFGQSSYYERSTGAGFADTTFRPVIWN